MLTYTWYHTSGSSGGVGTAADEVGSARLELQLYPEQFNTARVHHRQSGPVPLLLAEPTPRNRRHHRSCKTTKPRIMTQVRVRAQGGEIMVSLLATRLVERLFSPGENELCHTPNVLRGANVFKYTGDKT